MAPVDGERSALRGSVSRWGWQAVVGEGVVGRGRQAGRRSSEVGEER